MSETATVILSPEQEQVVTHRGTDLQVIACAGSGKTESISRRISALIAEGAEPTSIVAFTFTARPDGRNQSRERLEVPLG
jgi:DNA helicase-2/ATP-dependent DNA helicase PcrA